MLDYGNQMGTSIDLCKGAVYTCQNLRTNRRTNPILQQTPITIFCVHVLAENITKLLWGYLWQQIVTNRTSIRMQNRTCRRPLTKHIPTR
jgi:hypothetical protein